MILQRIKVLEQRMKRLAQLTAIEMMELTEEYTKLFNSLPLPIKRRKYREIFKNERREHHRIH